jgi:hypothetical protein
MKKVSLALLLITLVISCKKAEAQKIEKIKNNSNMESSIQNIEFSDLFNEGSVIRFTPEDLKNPKNDAEREFKKKLQLFEKQHTIVEDFEPDDIKLLINDETFFEAKSYINKEWFDYFLNRYDLFYEFNELVELAIEQEDLNAINVLINHKYIFSIKDLNKAKNVKDEQKDKLQRNKDEEFDFYELKYSRIDEILKLVTQKYNSNKIFDKDGYTNLRVGKSSNSSVLAKINSGEHIEVLDNPDEEDWYLVKTKEGKKGYVHKSRIKSE